MMLGLDILPALKDGDSMERYSSRTQHTRRFRANPALNGGACALYGVGHG
jgi:hypothetical protein